jgi:hypothetical protein
MAKIQEEIDKVELKLQKASKESQENGKLVKKKQNLIQQKSSAQVNII